MGITRSTPGKSSTSRRSICTRPTAPRIVSCSPMISRTLYPCCSKKLRVSCFCCGFIPCLRTIIIAVTLFSSLSPVNYMRTVFFAFHQLYTHRSLFHRRLKFLLEFFTMIQNHVNVFQSHQRRTALGHSSWTGVIHRKSSHLVFTSFQAVLQVGYALGNIYLRVEELFFPQFWKRAVIKLKHSAIDRTLIIIHGQRIKPALYPGKGEGETYRKIVSFCFPQYEIGNFCRTCLFNKEIQHERTVFGFGIYLIQFG